MVESPPSRCATTISGFTSSVTVHMPSMPWKITVPSSSSGSDDRLLRVAAVGEREAGDEHDREAESGRHVAMDHLVPGLAGVERLVGKCLRAPRRARGPRPAP